MSLDFEDTDWELMKEQLEQMFEQSARKEAEQAKVEEPPPVPESAKTTTPFHRRIEMLAKKLGKSIDDLRDFKQDVWFTDREHLDVDNLEKEYYRFIATHCRHEWKPIQGLYKTWYNCKVCGIAKEKVIK